MFEFLNSLVVGAALTIIVSLFIGSGGSTGGFLNIHHFTIEEFGFYWSWVLFLIGTGLSFGLMSLMS